MFFYPPPRHFHKVMTSRHSRNHHHAQMENAVGLYSLLLGEGGKRIRRPSSPTIVGNKLVTRRPRTSQVVELSMALVMTNSRRNRMILLLSIVLVARQQDHAMAFSSSIFLPNGPSSLCTLYMSTEEETECADPAVEERNGRQSMLGKMSGMFRVPRPSFSMIPREVRFFTPAVAIVGHEMCFNEWNLIAHLYTYSSNGIPSFVRSFFVGLLFTSPTELLS